MIDRYGGKQSSIVCVALHGSPANRRAWLPLARVASAEIELVAPDLPGHGSRRDEPFTMDAALAVVDATIRGCGRPAIVAGDSLGGYVALAAASRVANVRAVVAGGCTFEMHGVASVLARVTDAPFAALLATVGPARTERLFATLARALLGAPIADPVAAAGLRVEARGESIRALAAIRTGDLVRAARVPIVFVNGSRDWPTRAHERRFLALARQAELVLAAGMPHGVSVLAPEVFARAILRADESGRLVESAAIG